jgi:hypothetical protein
MYLEGPIDETQVYNVALSANWLTTDFHAQTDNLLTWGEVEFVGYSGYFSGYVYEGVSTTISGATIYMYESDTGEYLGSTTSSGDGGFYIETIYSGSHFLVCQDPEGGETYNDLIYGQMFPVEIES